MRRITLVVMVAVVMAAMVVLIAGSVLAKDTQQKQSYVDTVEAEQYFALPGSAAWFRGTATDIPTDGDPGLTKIAARSLFHMVEPMMPQLPLRR